MASSGGYAGQCRDARRRGRELRGGVRGQVHAALGLLIEAVRTLDTRAHRTPGPSSPQAPSPDCDYGLSGPLTVMAERTETTHIVVVSAEVAPSNARAPKGARSRARFVKG